MKGQFDYWAESLNIFPEMKNYSINSNCSEKQNFLFPDCPWMLTWFINPKALTSWTLSPLICYSISVCVHTCYRITPPCCRITDCILLQGTHRQVWVPLLLWWRGGATPLVTITVFLHLLKNGPSELKQCLQLTFSGSTLSYNFKT